jgi:hypothetical protein
MNLLILAVLILDAVAVVMYLANKLSLLTGKSLV